MFSLKCLFEALMLALLQAGGICCGEFVNFDWIFYVGFKCRMCLPFLNALC